MKAIWLACCACGDYGLLQQEVEGRDVGAQVLRVGDLDGLVSMARAFPSRSSAAIIAASLFDTEDVRKTVGAPDGRGPCESRRRVDRDARPVGYRRAVSRGGDRGHRCAQFVRQRARG